jgi:uroporphyrin-3 C-methyltransferase
MVAWLALIVAAGAVLFAFYQTRDDGSDTAAASRAEAEIASLTASLAATRDSLDGLQNRLSTLSESDAANLRSMQSLERQLNDQFGQLESLPGRIGNLESSISALRGISSGVRDAWLLAEAEYYMQIGNAQLQLVGNPHLATLALRLADERIEELANPALTSVRRALAVELRSLDAMAKPDIEGIALTLASLATVVDSLPLREQLRALDEDVTEEELESELTGMDRAFASLKRTMSGIVSVRRTDAPLEPLLAPDERYFLRANLALQLQAARLALLQGEESLFEHSLDDATLWLEQYYDSENAAVSSALQTISEIRAVSFDVDVPDISESLRLLRQHNTLSEAAAEAPEMPDSDPEPAATEIEQ